MSNHGSFQLVPRRRHPLTRGTADGIPTMDSEAPVTVRPVRELRSKISGTRIQLCRARYDQGPHGYPVLEVEPMTLFSILFLTHQVSITITTNIHCNSITRKASPFLHRRTAGSLSRGTVTILCGKPAVTVSYC